MGWLGTWAKRRKITIDNTNIDSDLTHFPVPVPLGTSVGQSAQDVSNIFDEVGSSSLKIAITKSDGTTQIYAEVEQWDDVNQKALFWVSKSDLILTAASDPVLYIYYDSSQPDNTTYIGTPGNRTEVWHSDLHLRYSLAQDPSGGGTDAIKDSTANANHATPTGLTQAGSLLGLGVDIDAQADKLEATTLLTLSGAFQFDVLLYMRSFGDEDALFGDDSYNDGRLSFKGADSIQLTRSGNNNNNMPIPLSQPFPTNQWAALHVAREADNYLYVYIDDSLSLGSASATGDVDFRRIFEGPDNSGWQGMHDAIAGELRLWKNPRTAAWRKADYHAQTDNLLTWGAEELASSYEVSGFVTEGGTPVERTVRLYKRSDGSLVEETTSDYSDGSFLFDVLADNTVEYYVVALDDTSDAADYNALIYDRITPVEGGS